MSPWNQHNTATILKGYHRIRFIMCRVNVSHRFSAANHTAGKKKKLTAEQARTFDAFKHKLVSFTMYVTRMCL